eukprot:270521_1
MNTNLTRRSTVGSFVSSPTAQLTIPTNIDTQKTSITYTKLATDSPNGSDELNNISKYSIDDAISHVGIGWFQYRLLFLTGMINAADAMEMMLLSFLLPKLKKDWDLSSPWDGAIGAIAFVGSLLGTSSGAILSDKYGRKYVCIVSTLGLATFGTISAFSYNLSIMLGARFLVGFFVGFSCAAYTLFAEYCPTHSRGSLLVIEQSFWAGGALFSVILAWICLSDQFIDFGENDWRYFLFFTAVPLWIISLFYKFVPESPRWYVACNNTVMAQKMLNNLSEINGKPLPKGKLKVNNNLNIKRGRLKDIFCVKQYRHTSFLLYITFWCCVFAYYGISFLSERYFELFGYGDSVYLEMCISTASEIPSLFLGLILMDKIGRKNTMRINFIVFSICCVGLSVYNNSGYYGLAGVFLARMTISLSFMAIYIYFSEYYPTVIRSTALGCAGAFGRFAAIATSFISQDFSIQLGLSLYALAGFIAFICTHLLQHDTFGKDLATSVQSQINLMDDKIKINDMDVDSNED